MRLPLPGQAGIARERNLRKDLKKSMEEAREEMRMRVSGGGGGERSCATR